VAIFDETNRRGHVSEEPVYSAPARLLHWLIAILILVMAVTGLVMAERAEANIWDSLTNNLYASHKLLGLIVLGLVVVRLLYRLIWGRPADEPTISPFQRFASHAVHWSIYVLLIAIPLGGWIGVSLFPALDVFGLFQIPALTAPDQALSKQVLWVHGIAAYVLFALVGIHAVAALYHHIVRGDGVLVRMMPRLRRRI
jgi:cytochrome b561